MVITNQDYFMEYGSAKYLIQKVFQSKKNRDRKNKKQNLGNVYNI